MRHSLCPFVISVLFLFQSASAGTLLDCTSFFGASPALSLELSRVDQIADLSEQIHSRMDSQAGHHMEPISKDNILASMRRDEGFGFNHVWTEGDVAAGFVLLHPQSDVEGGVVKIWKLGVHPDFRGQGISRLLLHRFAQVAMQHRVKFVTLLVGSHNTHAMENIYLRYGFEIEKQRPIWTHMKAETEELAERTRDKEERKPE